MSKRQELRDIEEQKRLVVKKADLQRSTFLMLVSPIFQVLRTVEVGLFAVKTGKAVARHRKH